MFSKSLRTAVVGALVALVGTSALAQFEFKKTITLTRGAYVQPLEIGVRDLNTDARDSESLPNIPSTWAEPLAPPAPGAPLLGYATLRIGSQSTFRDIRAYDGAGAQPQTDVYTIRFQSEESTPGQYSQDIVISWNSADLLLSATGWTISGGPIPSAVDMLANSSVTIPNASIPDDGSFFQVTITKVGARVATPVSFSVSPSSVSFGQVATGTTSAPQLVTVSNTGVGPGNLTLNAPTAAAPFVVSEVGGAAAAGASLASGASKAYWVRFAPTASGAASGSVVFTFSGETGGPTSPQSVSLSGSGISNSLSFSSYAPANSVTQFDNSNYTDTLRLKVEDNLKALQFTLKTDGLIIIRSISRGAAVASASDWYFQTQFRRGGSNGDGTTEDSINVVLFGADPSDFLAGVAGGTTHDIAIVNYDVVNIENPDTASAPITLAHVVGSKFDGTNLGVSPLSLSVTALNRSVQGDVNNDDRIDILDMLLVVDHILGRSFLGTAGVANSPFERADVAPWPSGDGFVNALDLAMLQNIILTNQYPDGTRIMEVAPEQLPMAAAGAEKAAASVRVVYHVSEAGVVVRLVNSIPVRGLQLELENVSSLEAGKASSAFGMVAHKLLDGKLRMLVYNDNADMIPAGEHAVATVVMPIANPKSVTAGPIVAANESNSGIRDIEIGTSDVNLLPTEYELAQNFPNPFNPSTKIQFSVPQNGPATVTIFNTLGQEVRSLFAGDVARGTYSVEWDGRDNSGTAMSSGLYFYTLKSGTFSQTKKMMLVK
jgi:hypothetical protein